MKKTTAAVRQHRLQNVLAYATLSYNFHMELIVPAVFKRFDLLALLFFCGLFILFPQIDLQIAAWFYAADSQTFPLQNDPWLMLAYDATNGLSYFLLFTLSSMLFLAWFKPDEILRKNRKRIFYLWLVLLLAPGLVVNDWLKDLSDRARPRNISEFGGQQQYSPPLRPGHCDDCKSFSSGHAAFGFYFFAFALSSTRRTRVMWVPFAFGFGIGFVRMLQGGHYFSDVIFSGFVVWFTSLLLFHWLYDQSTTTKQ